MISVGEELFALHCKAYNLEPQREFPFYDGRKWRFDFCWPEYRLAVEVEGGTWQRGRHQTGTGYEQDCRKYNQAALDGWRVFRFTTDMVKSAEAIDTVLKAIREAQS